MSVSVDAPEQDDPLRGAKTPRPGVAIKQPGWTLLALVAGVLLLHLAIIDQPPSEYIFDETYYVPAAKCLLDGTVCNAEHPPLAKLLIALGIFAFGDNGFGWRLPSVFAGTVTLGLVYLLTRRLADDRSALLAAFLLGFENLWFVHSSIAMLDIIAISLSMLCVYLFTMKRWCLAGIALGIGMLAKEVVAIQLIALILFAFLSQERWRSMSAWKNSAKIGALTSIPALLTFFAGLGIYDLKYKAFRSPLHHVAYMIRHNQEIGTQRMSDSIHPIRWFSGFPDSPYFVTSVSIEGAVIPRNMIQYIGQPNLVLLLFIWLAIPLIWSDVRKRNPLMLLTLLMIVIPYLFFIAVAHTRVTYPFYMLIFTPSLCILSSLALWKLPRSAIVSFCIGVLAWFFYAFPKNPLTLWGN